MRKNNLKIIRKKLNTPAKKLAELSGVSSSLICYYEKGEREPLLSTAYKIAAVLDVTVYEIWPPNIEIIEQTITIRKIKEAGNDH